MKKIEKKNILLKRIKVHNCYCRFLIKIHLKIKIFCSILNTNNVVIAIVLEKYKKQNERNT